MSMSDNDVTLILVWVFTWLAMGIMTLRLVLRKVRRQDFVPGDYFTMAAMFCAMVRLGMIHVVLIWGSNNVTPQFRKAHHFTPEEIYQREIGSKLTITNRFFYNSYLWFQKLVLLDFSRHIIKKLRYEKIALWIVAIFLFGSYVAAQITTFSECDPFHLYWQVLPDPGNCSQAQVQLFVLGILNIFTDFLLMVLPLPVLLKWKQPLLRKLQVTTLFCLGFFIIAVTIIRLPQNHNHATAQVNRTTWASTELLAAALAVNAPVLYSLRKRRDGHSAGLEAGSGSRGSGSKGRGSKGSRGKFRAWGYPKKAGSRGSGQGNGQGGNDEVPTFHTIGSLPGRGEYEIRKKNLNEMGDMSTFTSTTYEDEEHSPARPRQPETETQNTAVYDDIGMRSFWRESNENNLDFRDAAHGTGDPGGSEDRLVNRR